MKRYLFIPVIFLALVQMGCEEKVDAIIGDDRPYTIWGLLDAGADTQRVRVIPITTELGIPQGENLDAQVFSTNLETNERREWQDEYIEFSNGTFGHVFWSAFTPEILSSYKLEVVRSDGATSSAVVELPDSIFVDLPDGAEQRRRVDMRISGPGSNLIQANLNYQTFSLPPGNPWPAGTPPSQSVQLPVNIDYVSELERSSAGFEVELDISRDFQAIRQEFEFNCLNPLTIGVSWLTFTVFVGDPMWLPPGGEFDERILAQPGVLSNVDNGLGFVGAGYGAEARWFPSNSVKSGAGFALQGSCSLMPANIPECAPQIACLKE